jgi:hypothetical protein
MMNTLTINIPDEMMQKLEAQNQPLQTLILQALNDYLQKYPKVEAKTDDLTKTKTWELCGKFEIHKPTSNGQRMADALNHIALTHSLAELDPITWQKDTRGDRPLSDRN